MAIQEGTSPGISAASAAKTSATSTAWPYHSSAAKTESSPALRSCDETGTVIASSRARVAGFSFSSAAAMVLSR